MMLAWDKKNIERKMKMNSKAKGVLSYLLGWIGGLIVMFAFKDNNKRDVTHAAQAITISVADLAFGIIISIMSGIMYAAVGFSISFLASIFSLLCIALRIIGLVKALKDDADPLVPVVGDIAVKLFEKQINAAPDAPATVVAKFDPNTGQPITTPEAKFDPNTGEPITKPEETKPEEPTTAPPIEVK